MAEPRRTLPTALMMPAAVRAGQVISLVDVTGGLGVKVDIPKLADELGADIAVLLPILDGAEMLGLARIEKGDVHLTELGLKFHKTSQSKLKVIRDRLAAIEPFRTALELASRGKSIKASQVSDALAEMGLKWHYQPDINESLIRALLVHWAISGGLLTYDGKSGKFSKA